MGFEDPFNRPSACAREILELAKTQLIAGLEIPEVMQNRTPECLFVDGNTVCDAIAFVTRRGKTVVTDKYGETPKQACLYLARRNRNALGDTALGSS